MTLSAAGRRWAVSTPHHLATEAAVGVVDSGGNAIDAALTAATTLAVVYPHMCGIGGDLFALVQQPNGIAVAVNGSGRAGSNANVDAARAAGAGRMPLHGPHSVTVPGAVSGWGALHRLGATVPWATLFDAAIDAAENGTPVTSSLAESLSDAPERLRRDPGMAATFFDPGGAPLSAGALVHQPALGSTLRAVASGGPHAWYHGDVGAAYVAGLAALGATLVPDDLHRHAAELAVPLAGRFGDLEVLVHPPNSPGFSLLQILALVDELVPSVDPSGPDAPTLAAIFATAWAQRDRYLADPATMPVPAADLISDEHVRDLARATASATPSGMRQRSGSGDTIALVTADAEGRSVCLIQSLFDGFGSGLLEPSTGVVAQNRGACFTVTPDQPNTLTPRRRPAHTLMPTLVRRNGQVVAVPGSMGGLAQPQINATTLLRMLRLGETPGDAVARPRWLLGGADGEGDQPGVIAEADVAASTITALHDAGWPVEVVPSRSSWVGHAHAIRVSHDADGVTFDVGCDPRSDGAAAAG